MKNPSTYSDDLTEEQLVPGEFVGVRVPPESMLSGAVEVEVTKERIGQCKLHFGMEQAKALKEALDAFFREHAV